MTQAPKVVLVTGASAGIGLATADRLHRSGWTVVGASRRVTSPGTWHPVTMDVDDDDDVNRGVGAVVEQHGRLDAVVAAAGWGLAGAVEATPIADAKAQLETNFWGVVRVVQASLPVMRRQGGGRIVMMSSIGGLIALPFQAFYSASKFALEGYGEALAYEVRPFGIQVTLVEPGNFRTGFTEARRRVPDTPDGSYAAAADKAITLMARDEARGGSPEDVAAVVERVLNARHPRRRVSVGKASERVGIPAKRLLPHELFEKGAASSLGV
jgi:NAD(P)-dependent dehydrogenase (short-subunit alcohol dehydrogenase family)